MSQVQSVYSGFWLAAETYTTLGYGEVRPEGGFSRLVCCLVAVAGVFTNTVVVTSLLRSAKLKPTEQLFALKLHDMLSRRSYRLISIVLVQRWWKLLKARRTEADTVKIQLTAYKEQLKKHIRAKSLRRRPTPDIAELLHHYAYITDGKFQETLRILRPLPVVNLKLTRLCTELFSCTSSLLLLKRKAMNLRAILIGSNRQRKRIRSVGRRLTIVSKTQQKLATNEAFVRMLERGTSTRLTLALSPSPAI